jgi:hypothetical protein
VVQGILKKKKTRQLRFALIFLHPVDVVGLDIELVSDHHGWIYASKVFYVEGLKLLESPVL